ncbi:MAG: hypothetical protein ACI909_000671 [Planctomycetota bacterium]|jgi:hypothetical protein
MGVRVKLDSLISTISIAPNVYFYSDPHLISLTPHLF